MRVLPLNYNQPIEYMTHVRIGNLKVMKLFKRFMFIKRFIIEIVFNQLKIYPK